MLYWFNRPRKELRKYRASNLRKDIQKQKPLEYTSKKLDKKQKYHLKDKQLTARKPKTSKPMEEDTFLLIKQESIDRTIEEELQAEREARDLELMSKYGSYQCCYECDLWCEKHFGSLPEIHLDR